MDLRGHGTILNDFWKNLSAFMLEEYSVKLARMGQAIKNMEIDYVKYQGDHKRDSGNLGRKKGDPPPPNWKYDSLEEALDEWIEFIDE